MQKTATTVEICGEIDNSIAQGRLGVNCPLPDEWLYPYWKIGAQLAHDEAVRALYPVIPFDSSSIPDAPEAPPQYDANENSAWQSGWSSGYAAALKPTGFGTFKQPPENEYSELVYQGLMALSQAFHAHQCYSIADELRKMALRDPDRPQCVHDKDVRPNDSRTPPGVVRAREWKAAFGISD